MQKLIFALVFALILIPPTTTAQTTYPFVAFGDSITSGACVAPGESFIGILQVRFGVIDNRAISGSRTAAQVAAMQSYSGSATKAIWLSGYNDMRAGLSANEYGAQLRSGLDVLSARGMTVYLGLTLRMTPTGYVMYAPDWNHGSDELVAAYQQTQIAIAAQYPNVVIADTRGYSPSNVCGDWVHPNAAGHQAITDAFIEKMAYRVFIPTYIHDSNVTFWR